MVGGEALLWAEERAREERGRRVLGMYIFWGGLGGWWIGGMVWEVCG